MRILAILLLCSTAFAQLPDKPKPRVVDKKFIAVAAFSVGTAVLDVHSTRYCFNNNPRCYEGQGIFAGSRPSTAKLTAVNAPMQAGILVGTYYLKRRGFKGWWLLPVGFGAARIYIASVNYRNAGR